MLMAMLAMVGPLHAGITYTVGVESLVGHTSSNGTLDLLTVRVGKFTTGFTPSANNYDQWLSHFTLLMPAQDLVTDGTAFIIASNPDTGPWRMASNSLTINQGSDPAGFATGDAIYVWISNASASGSSTEAALLTDTTWTYTMAAAGPQTPVTFRLQDEAPTVIAGTFIHHFTDSASEVGIRLVTQNIPSITPSNGSIAFSALTASYNEDAGTVNLTLTRTNGSVGSVSVTVNSSDVSATAGSDYVAISNTVVTFADGQTSKTVPLTILNDSIAETNETCTLTLSDPTGGVTLGANSTVTVTIVDLGDTTPPTVTITAPAANASLPEGAVIAQGGAADNRGLSKVQVQLNGGTWTDVTLGLAPNGLSGTWFAPLSPLNPRGGINQLSVRSQDTRGNYSPIVTRRFAYVVVRPLTVNRVGTASYGTLTAPFPGTDNNRRTGTTYSITATSKPGYFFAGWTANAWTGTGVTADTAKSPTLSFIMQEGLVLTATFVTSPFSTAITGTYYGLIMWSNADPAPYGTIASNETAGFITATVTPLGGVTGKLTMDGQTFSIIGQCDDSGVVRFGTNKATTMDLIRTVKPTLSLSLKVGLTAPDVGGITGTVTQTGRSKAVVAVSSVLAIRSSFSSTNKVPASFAGNRSQRYTAVFPYASAQRSPFTNEDYPRGNGYATGTLNTAGAVSFTGVLADGTVSTISSAVSDSLYWPLYVQLYGGKGCIIGWVQLDSTLGLLPMHGGLVWFRPFQLTQWYSLGWPEGITLGFSASKYAVPPATPTTSVFPGPAPSGVLKPVDPVNGNATLVLDGGLLPSLMEQTVNVAKSNVISLVPNTDKSVTMSIAASTGIITGSFLHPDGTRPALKGVVIQDGLASGGFGFFLSTKPSNMDYAGETGGWSLRAK